MGRKQDDIDRIAELENEVETLSLQLTNLRDDYANLKTELCDQLTEIVETEGEDAGVVYLSDHGTCHNEEHDGVSLSVYDREYFSPLGDRLMKLGYTIQLYPEAIPEYFSTPNPHIKNELP